MRRSAGILMYKYRADELLVLLVHPGGPYWAKRDLGSWSIPKGEYEGEDPLTAAGREFQEETGGQVQGPFLSLGEVTHSNRKTVSAWAAEGDFDPKTLKSNLCEIEWPPKSGITQLIPEADRAEWFSLQDARVKILAGQRPFLDRLESALKSG
ncbi:MAG: NUDIX domain-containing protein [Rhodomicrobium sp.]